jgi:hypothetical protein
MYKILLASVKIDTRSHDSGNQGYRDTILHEVALC